MKQLNRISYEQLNKVSYEVAVISVFNLVSEPDGLRSEEERRLLSLSKAAVVNLCVDAG